MTRSTRDAWLEGSGDLKEAVVEDVPVQGQSVKVRGLGAKYSAQAQDSAVQFKTRPDGESIATVSSEKMAILQFAHGVVEPQFSVEEAEKIAERFGPAYLKTIEKIDELSGVDKEAIESAKARFPSVGGEAPTKTHESNGDATTAGGSGPDVPVRASAGAGEERP